MLVIVGVALALIMVPSQTATFETISSPDMTRASSLFSTMCQFASAAGVAVMVTILMAQVNANVAELSPSASTSAPTDAAVAGYEAG